MFLMMYRFRTSLHFHTQVQCKDDDVSAISFFWRGFHSPHGSSLPRWIPVGPSVATGEAIRWVAVSEGVSTHTENSKRVDRKIALSFYSNDAISTFCKISVCIDASSRENAACHCPLHPLSSM
jgi:hypothetical protein